MNYNVVQRGKYGGSFIVCCVNIKLRSFKFFLFVVFFSHGNSMYLHSVLTILYYALFSIGFSHFCTGFKWSICTRKSLEISLTVYSLLSRQSFLVTAMQTKNFPLLSGKIFS